MKPLKLDILRFYFSKSDKIGISIFSWNSQGIESDCVERKAA
jgi:hypothetical protein